MYVNCRSPKKCAINDLVRLADVLDVKVCIVNKSTCDVWYEVSVQVRVAKTIALRFNCILFLRRHLKCVNKINSKVVKIL